MKSIKQNQTPILYTSIVYICGFFLFLEWLYPIEEVTNTSDVNVFLIYTLFCFFISLLKLNWILSCFLKGFGMLFILNSLYFTEAFLSKWWFEQLFAELSMNIGSLFSQQLYNLTPLFRSFLFLLLIWLMSYLLYYWFVVMKRIFLFVILTFIYITVLDTFTTYDASMAIVRTFIISFIVLGLTNFIKNINLEEIRFPWAKRRAIWVMPLISIVLLASFIGYVAPKFDPQWPDPVPFLKSAAENAGGSGSGSTIRKVGYGEDDSQLGGSFVQDDTPVFQAAVEEEHYWRIETKDVYTGKGWENANPSDYQLRQKEELEVVTFAEGVETEELEAIIGFDGSADLQKLIYPYGMTKVETSETGQFLFDPYSEAVQTQKNGEKASLTNYSITYQHPSFAIDELRESGEEDNLDFKEHYTQLPEALPDRIGELAAEVTESEDNRYDKAKAIEQYFGRNGFTYQISDVPVPEEEQDYVDQFLFDSQVGYCDNFSTSMVVMLRSLDIPARWVKGFTSGEKISETNVGLDVYKVTNNNAHSWVEVHFPGIGWVPFEPTQGFSNLTDFHMNIDPEDIGSEDSTETDTESAYETPELEENPNLQEGEAVSADATSETNEGSINWWLIIGIIAFVLGLGYVVYKIWYRITSYFVLVKLMRKKDAETFQLAYHHMLKVLKHTGLGKEEDQTLREYAERIDRRYETTAMNQLTNYYEQILYRNEIDDSKIEELTQIWKDLIKKILS
ncbi:transglutaminase TgpA family protein [Oceanobacillus halotolerans]|uniref:transglutaminase TgpA family protein n=1 Tax=Oceanobacillus halotolerans TaxID=2663380 RepID=UPI0013DAC777|nr:transglutaminaseTgpA domain-containing protein [Oceanobacillus halotolerans]